MMKPSLGTELCGLNTRVIVDVVAEVIASVTSILIGVIKPEVGVNDPSDLPESIIASSKYVLMTKLPAG